MINYLRHMAVFARVVDEGSFRAAARDLSVAPSRVSQTISDLEQYIGVTLMYRSTRKLSLTTDGRKFYQHAAEIMRNAEAGMNELNSLSQKPFGELKVTLPAFLVSSNISQAIGEFAKQYADISLSLIYTDQRVDLLDQGIDLTIRVGWLEDSSMLSRKLTESRRLLVASPEYLKALSKPQQPADIINWDWLHFNVRASTIEFTHTNGKIVRITENSRLVINSAEAIANFACQGVGVAILPEHLISKKIESGELVEVLPEWKLKPLGFYAVWPDKSRRESLTLLLVRYLADKIYQ